MTALIPDEQEVTMQQIAAHYHVNPARLRAIIFIEGYFFFALSDEEAVLKLIGESLADEPDLMQGGGDHTSTLPTHLPELMRATHAEVVEASAFGIPSGLVIVFYTTEQQLIYTKEEIVSDG